jgi:predicted ATPase/DNA-binding CsgD family transcriptional regulator
MEQNNIRIFPIRTGEALDSTAVAQIPIPLTSFIGREQEVTAICKLLQESTVRLLTLTGPGGVGKTRLGLAAAKQLLPCFPDGIFFISFASIHDPLLILPHIASALELDEQIGLSPGEQLKTHLRHSSLLLLLDNFEHLLRAAPLLVELLQLCPLLKMLVTSRAVLRVQGEHVYEVTPLPLPKRYHATTIEASPAVQLFVERARALKADFTLTSANRQAILEICTHLDGLPLAIELAAARINLLPPQALLKRLEHRLPLLTTGGPDVHWRQQTLRNTLQWSYDLLNQQEQCLFRTLSVFTGGCLLEAVEAVSDEGENLVDVIGSLIDKSLLFRREYQDGALRLFLLETVREYGAACLQASGEAEDRYRRHAEYFLALAEEAEAKLAGAEQLTWLARLEQEHDNLRAALNWLIASEQMELALRLESALFPFWTMHNHMSEGHHWLEKTLREKNEVSLTVRTKTLYAAASFSFFQGDNNKAAALFEECLHLAQASGDKHSLLLALNGLGHTALAQHRYTVVLHLGEENLLLAKEVGDRWKIAESFFLLAHGYFAQGRYPEARAAGEECLALSREFSEPSCLAHAIHLVSRIAYRQNDLAVACTLYQECLARAMDLDEQWLITACLIGLGEVAAALGKYTWAARLWGTEEALHETIRARRLYLIRTPDEEPLAAARAGLGDDAFDAEWVQGRTLSVEQALVTPLGELSSELPHLFSQQVTSFTSPSTDVAKRKSEPPDELTIREVEVLHLIANGLTNRQIAQQLVISPTTVNTHIRSIYNKLGISSRSAATRYVLKQQQA